MLSRSAPLLACLGLLGVWQVAALILNNDSFPTALEAIRAIPSILGDKESLINILASLRRMAIGFGVAVMVSIPLGLMMGRSRAVASFFNPLLMVIYPVPKAALMPIIMLWLGVGDVSKTLVIFLGVSLPVIYHSFQGAKAVEEKMLWSGAAMGLSAAQRMIRIVLPAALPEILTGCRTGLVLALITMVTSEMIARQSGAGNILFNALDMGQYDTVFAMIIIIGAMGIGLDAAFEKMRAQAREMVRAALRSSIELLMNARAVTTDVLLGIVPIALLIGLWQAIDSFGYAPVTLLPPPGAVFMRLAQQLATTAFQQEIGATLFRLFAGFSIAVILGVGIGLAAAASPAVNAVVRPLVRVLAPLPKVALYPALLLLLGFGHESKIMLVAADALFPILLSTYYGASMVEQKLIWSAMAAGTPRHQILFKVVLPAAVPSILTGCRIGLVISCIVVFLAEMITSTDGLGHLLVTAARTFQAVDMFVPLITISLLGPYSQRVAAGGAVLSAARVSGSLTAAPY